MRKRIKASNLSIFFCLPNLEEGQPKPGEYEVSSKQSLGLAERETVKAFWDNVKKLKEEEEAAPEP